MRKRNTAIVGLVLAFALVAAACGGDDGTEATSTTAATTTTQATTTTAATTTSTEALAPLVVWTDETRFPVVESIAPAFTEATGVEVIIEQQDFGEMRNQVITAAPVGEGPDIFIGAHDWVGELAVNGVIEPIDLAGREDEWVPVSLDVFTYEGTLYGVPYATEAVALYYNADLVPEAPATFEEIPAVCDALSGLENCIGLPGGGDGSDAYHHYPFVSVLGGYIFAYSDGVYDPSDVGLDSEESIAGVSFLETLVDDGYVASTNYDNAKALFLAGTEPFWITGPWEIGALGETELNWAVAKLPTIEGNTPAPFVGAQAFFINSFSENKTVAEAFLLQYVATQETMKALYDADPRNPAFQATYDEISSDPVAATFALSAADGVPMPNIAEMNSVWGPLGDQLRGMRNGEIDAATAMTNAATQVREAVGG